MPQLYSHFSFKKKCIVIQQVSCYASKNIFSIFPPEILHFKNLKSSQVFNNSAEKIQDSCIHKKNEPNHINLKVTNTCCKVLCLLMYNC